MDAAVLQVMQNYPNVVTNIEWHVWWPGAGDPFYEHNTGPVINRKNWYPFNAVPHVRIDGTQRSGTYSAMTSYINLRLGTESPLEIDVSGIIVGGSPTGTCEISVDVTVETPVSGTNYRLFVASIEKYIAQAGTWHNVFRWINNNDGFPNGESIDLSTTGLQHFDVSLPFHSIYQHDEMAVVAWVQNYSGTKEVLQADETLILMPYYVRMVPVGLTRVIAADDEVVNFEGAITNEGINNDTYDITVQGVPASWNYSYTTPAGTFSGPSTLALSSEQSASFTLELDSQGQAGPATATFEVVSQGQPLNFASLDFQKLNGLDVLLVDDDGAGSREEYVEPGIAAAGVTWGTWELAQGELTATDLDNAASTIFWMCGVTSPSLTPNDRAALGTFMDNGGSVFVSGADIAVDLAYAGSVNHTPESEQWFEDYLHAFYGTSISFSWQIAGTPGDPIGDGLPVLVLAQSGPTVQMTPDGITPGAGAEIPFTYNNNQWEASIRWEGPTHKVVYFAFGIEGIVSESPRYMIIDRIIDYLAPTTAVETPAGAAPLVRLAQNVPNPFRPATMISYDLGAAGAVSLRIYDVNGRLVRTLVNASQPAQVHSIEWTGTDDVGRAVASGVYFYRLEAPGIEQTRRMVLNR